METVSDFIFLGSKITADGDCSHEIKRRLLLGRKAMTNLDSILKSRHISLPAKVHIVKAMVFPVAVNTCEMVLCRFSHVSLFVTLWTVAHQAPLSMGILQARILGWVAISFSKESSQPRIDQALGLSGANLADLGWASSGVCGQLVSWWLLRDLK